MLQMVDHSFISHASAGQCGPKKWTQFYPASVYLTFKTIRKIISKLYSSVHCEFLLRIRYNPNRGRRVSPGWRGFEAPFISVTSLERFLPDERRFFRISSQLQFPRANRRVFYLDQPFTQNYGSSKSIKDDSLVCLQCDFYSIVYTV